MSYAVTSQEEMEERAREELLRRQSTEGIPSMQPLAFSACSQADGWLELFHVVEPWEKNNAGFMHGGMIACALDSSMGTLCRLVTGDAWTPTLDIHVNFLRGIQIGETLHIRSSLLHLGRGSVRLRADAWTSDQRRLCATADGIFYRKQS